MLCRIKPLNFVSVGYVDGLWILEGSGVFEVFFCVF